MNALLFLLPLIAIGLTTIPIVPILTNAKTGTTAKNRFILHLCLFFGVMLLMVVLMITTGMVSAAEATKEAQSAASMNDGLKYIGAALSTGLASIGAGIGVGCGSPAAIGACSEDPKAFGKAMIFVVLGEGIAIYGLVISFLILFTQS